MNDAPLQAPRIYLIAGEASGDFLGASLMDALNQNHSGTAIEYRGIGGEKMQQAGLHSLFDIQQISLMGFVEVLPHIFRLKRLIKHTVADIIRQQPDLLLTIDSPGFCFRVSVALKEAGVHIPMLHYVAPSVWAYKPQRAKKTAALYDRLMTLLPFEPPYFEQEGLKSDFVGHPVAWLWRTRGDGDAFRTRHGIAQNALVLGLMPGSRKGEVLRHMPIFRQLVQRLMQHDPSLQVVMPIRKAMRPMVEEHSKNWPCPLHLIAGDAEKKDAFAAMQVAVVKSGTVGLEAVLAGVPSITAYIANPVSVWLVRRMALIRWSNLANILMQREVVPELIQEHCTPARLTQAVIALLEQPEHKDRQQAASAALMEMLGANETISPSERAAHVVEEMLASRQKAKALIMPEDVQQQP